MKQQDNTDRAVMPKETKTLLEAMDRQAVGSVSGYFVVKRFADEFNRSAVPALREAGVKTLLRAEFIEAGTKCEIQKGSGMFGRDTVTSVTAETLEKGEEGAAHIAKSILDALPLDDREKIEHNMSRVLAMK